MWPAAFLYIVMNDGDRYVRTTIPTQALVKHIMVTSAHSLNVPHMPEMMEHALSSQDPNT